MRTSLIDIGALALNDLASDRICKDWQQNRCREDTSRRQSDSENPNLEQETIHPNSSLSVNALLGIVRQKESRCQGPTPPPAKTGINTCGGLGGLHRVKRTPGGTDIFAPTLSTFVRTKQAEFVRGFT
jgi:hypothetical protein